MAAKKKTPKMPMKMGGGKHMMDMSAACKKKK